MHKIGVDVYWFHPSDGGEVYFAVTAEGLAMFDSGFLRHRDRLLSEMDEARLDPNDIRLAFVTHFHCDHVGAMGWWQNEFGFPVVAHELAAGPIETADRLATGAELPYIGFSEDFAPCTITYKVRGGETFDIGERVFETIFAPGHTAGSLHVVAGENVFAGDTIFESGGIGWMDVHWGSHPDDYVETLTRMRPHVGKTICPGHGAPYVLTEEILEKTLAVAGFYVSTDHGFGSPRAKSGYARYESP